MSAWSLPNRKFARRSRQLGLADTRRSEEDEAADGTIRRFQARSRPANGAGEGRNGLVLRDDAPVKGILHVEELVAFILVDRRQRHARPFGDDLVDLGLADDHAPGAGFHVELLAYELQVLSRLHFLLAVELRLLEVLLGDGVFHLLDRDADAAVDLAELLAVARLAQLGTRARFVNQIDRLVGQEPVGDVAVGLIDGRFDRFARVLDVVEGLVTILDAHQDFDRFTLRRRIDLDRLEAALERTVLLDVFPILGRRGRADAAYLAAGERRFQDVRGVEGAFRRPRTDQRMQLVDEDDDVRVLGQLLHDRLEAFFELTAVLRPRDNKRDIQRQNPLVRQEVRNVAVDDLLRQALDDRRLPDARLANKNGVVLRASAEDLLYAFHFQVTPNQRVELVFHRPFGQVPRELGQKGCLLHSREGGLLVEQRDDIFADRIEPHPLFHEDGRGHGPFFAQDAEQQVLGSDVVVKQPIRFFGSKLQDSLGFSAEGDFDGGRDLLAEDGASLNLLANTFQGQMRAGEDPARKSLAFANQAQQEMLGLDRNAAELTGLVAREEEDPPRSFRVTFEHPVTYE